MEAKSKWWNAPLAVELIILVIPLVLGAIVYFVQLEPKIEGIGANLTNEIHEGDDTLHTDLLLLKLELQNLEETADANHTEALRVLEEMGQRLENLMAHHWHDEHGNVQVTLGP